MEECLICCGDFFIFGGGVGLLLNLCMPLVEMNTWFLISAQPIPFNICVLTAFLFSWIDLDQHSYLNFGCGPFGCGDVDNPVFVRACVGIWPTVVQLAAKIPYLHGFGSCKQNSHI